MSVDIAMGSLQINVEEDKWNKAIVEEHLTDIASYLEKGGIPPVHEDVKASSGASVKVNLGERLLNSALSSYKNSAKQNIYEHLKDNLGRNYEDFLKAVEVYDRQSSGSSSSQID